MNKSGPPSTQRNLCRSARCEMANVDSLRHLSLVSIFHFFCSHPPNQTHIYCTVRIEYDHLSSARKIDSRRVMVGLTFCADGIPNSQ